MIKQAIAEAGLAPFAVIGLVIFVSIFVGIAIWAFTRRAQQLTGWSSMPLADGHTVKMSSPGKGKNRIDNSEKQGEPSC